LAPGCIRYEIGTCLGPCAAACSRDDYAVQVGAVLSFLRGEDTSPLEAIERAMMVAAAKLEYERAAALRDKLDSLGWLCEQLQRVREACRHSFVYPVRGHDETELWYLVDRGCVRAVVPSPRDEASRRSVMQLLEAVYQREKRCSGPPGLGEIDGVLLVAAWFRRRMEEQQRILKPSAALSSR
jgi:excinuclease ABC subunit C